MKKNEEYTEECKHENLEKSKKERIKDDKKVIQELAQNYVSREKSLVNQLTIQASNHYPTVGTYREEVWKTLFESIVPKKYCIEQGIFIIDSGGNISSEVDLAVFDEMYTPYIFNCGKIKFIPIEAVAIVVQCKSKISNSYRKDMEDNLTKWSESIDCLKTELNAVIRTITDVADSKFPDDTKGRMLYTQTSTRPIKILCATEFSIDSDKIRKQFDFILYLKNGRIVKEINGENEYFVKWYYKLNHYDHQNPDTVEPSDEKAKEKRIKKVKNNGKRTLQELRIHDKENHENVIMSLTFQLNQLLMLINNPMMFPHAAYVKRFNEILEERNIRFDK